MKFSKQKFFLAPTLSLFASAGTLVCCALPALFVSLGAGASLVSLLTKVPQLIWVSEHKGAVFTVAGVGLILGGLSQLNARRLPCPVDPELGKACMSARRFSRIIYLGSVGVFLVGAGFAFIAPLLL